MYQLIYISFDFTPKVRIFDFSLFLHLSDNFVTMVNR